MRSIGIVFAILIICSTVLGGVSCTSMGRKPMGKEPSLESEPRVLNNLVTELVNLESLPVEPYREFAFTNPRDGWVFVSCTAHLEDDAAGMTTSLDAGQDDPLFVHRPGAPDMQEAMRYLKAGEHKLRIRRSEGTAALKPVVEKLVIRAVPALMYCSIPASAHSGYGRYDFDFLAKDVLPNINTIVGSGSESILPLRKQWRKRGGQWYLEQNLPSVLRDAQTPDGKPEFPDIPEPLTASYAYDWWAKSSGFTAPAMDGLLADEVVPHIPREDYAAYIAAIKKIAGDKRFAGRAVHLWIGGRMYRSPEATELLNTAIAAGYKAAWEVYLPEAPTEQKALELFDVTITEVMKNWEKAHPNFAQKLIFVLGILCAPPESLNVNPHVDYKVFLDMQYHHLANSPECAGLYGVMSYKSAYAEEEALRWCGRLFRHYCIEGKRNLLSEEYGFKYQLDHITNADFDDGLNGWTVAAAAPGSVDTTEISGLPGKLGRYKSPRNGRFCLRMKRQAAKPNKVSQEIRNLEQGRLYSLKLIAADYQDILNKKVEKKRLAISIDIENVTTLPEKRLDADVTIFGKGWINHHRIVFRAQDTTAMLTISDWADDNTPGGPIGQELICNFVEIQPYLEG